MAAVLLSVLPLQIGLVAPVSTGPGMAQAASGAPQGAEASPPAANPHHDEMPADDMSCGEDGLCETGLMYCSVAGAICTLLFFSPPEDFPYAVQTTSVDDGWSSQPTPVTAHKGHPTPPPRA